MFKCQELIDPRSCLNKADTLEPLFVLRAHDPVAPQTIRHWATMAEGLHEQEKIVEALRAADAMEQWLQNENAPQCSEES